MNLAYLDIRHNLGRFLLTCVGLGLLLGVVLAMRAAMALTIARGVLNDTHVFRWLALVPLRDFLGLFVWLAGFMGSEITWRGDSFELRNGKLVRIGS